MIKILDNSKKMNINKLYRAITLRCLKLLSLIISTLLGIFCNSISKMNETEGAYGMQYADYKVSGTVVSSDQNLAVKGLLIIVRDTMGTYKRLDSTMTDSLGRYSLEFSGPPFDNIWDLNVKDIDSTENGSFFSKDTTISIPESELKGRDAPYYLGHAEKKVDLKLDKKQ